jgi:hypothetical protein
MGPVFPACPTRGRWVLVFPPGYRRLENGTALMQRETDIATMQCAEALFRYWRQILHDNDRFSAWTQFEKMFQFRPYVVYKLGPFQNDHDLGFEAECRVSIEFKIANAPKEEWGGSARMEVYEKTEHFCTFEICLVVGRK